jgi:hypothetical protein
MNMVLNFRFLLNQEIWVDKQLSASRDRLRSMELVPYCLLSQNGGHRNVVNGVITSHFPRQIAVAVSAGYGRDSVTRSLVSTSFYSPVAAENNRRNSDESCELCSSELMVSFCHKQSVQGAQWRVGCTYIADRNKASRRFKNYCTFNFIRFSSKALCEHKQRRFSKGMWQWLIHCTNILLNIVHRAWHIWNAQYFESRPCCCQGAWE